MLHGFYRFHRFIGSQLKKIAQTADNIPMETHELAVLRMETEILWPERCAVLESLLERSLLIIDAGIRHRRMARDTDPVARMEADDMWPHYLKEVDKYRAVVARKGA